SRRAAIAHRPKPPPCSRVCSLRSSFFPGGWLQCTGMAYETAQHLARMRRCTYGAQQRLRILALALKRIATGLQVATHVGGAEFGVKLHAPGRLAPAEGMAGIERGTRQHGGAIGRAQHALQVRGLGGEPLRQAGEQRIAGGGRQQLEFHRPHLASCRVVGDSAAERVRQLLVAVADAQHRHAGARGIGQVLPAAFAPRVAVGDHGAGAGGDHAGEAVWRRQRLALLDVDHHDGVARQPGGDPDPVWKTAVAAHRGDRLAGLEDQEGVFHALILARSLHATTRMTGPTFQELIQRLNAYWAGHGCVLIQPLDLEVGAGTFHPATFLRAIGPEPWAAAYVQPCRRPTDGRYGENPNRLQRYYQYQVVMKPNPDDIQALYLGSLVALGVDPKVHDL